MQFFRKTLRDSGFRAAHVRNCGVSPPQCGRSTSRSYQGVGFRRDQPRGSLLRRSTIPTGFSAVGLAAQMHPLSTGSAPAGRTRRDTPAAVVSPDSSVNASAAMSTGRIDVCFGIRRRDSRRQHPVTRKRGPVRHAEPAIGAGATSAISAACVKPPATVERGRAWHRRKRRCAGGAVTNSALAAAAMSPAFALNAHAIPPRNTTPPPHPRKRCCGPTLIGREKPQHPFDRYRHH